SRDDVADPGRVLCALHRRADREPRRHLLAFAAGKKRRLSMAKKICEVHNVPMKRGTVPIRYGLGPAPPGWGGTREKEFPNANSYIMGGCLVDVDNPETDRVTYCPVCRAAENEYIASGRI